MPPSENQNYFNHISEPHFQDKEKITIKFFLIKEYPEK